VKSAGSWVDTDSEMMVWTDIFYDMAVKTTGDELGEAVGGGIGGAALGFLADAATDDDGSEVPVPGMSYIEVDFAKDAVDLPVVARFLASKCSQLGSMSTKPPTPAKNLLVPGEPGGVEKFLNWLGQDFRQVEPGEMDARLHGDCNMLLPEETVQLAFVCGRDTLILTTHRALYIDVKGWTGKKVMYFSIPYTKLRGYSFESAGSWDTDAEMNLYVKAPWFEYQKGSLSLDMKKGRADIVAMQKFICEQVIGKADGTSVVPRTVVPPQPQGSMNTFLNWIGDDHHQISQEDITNKLRSDPEILLSDEPVDLAFKCGRDMPLFTTKRLLHVDVQGLSGKKVSYTSVPYRYIPSFAVVGAATHPFDLDAKVKIYSDCPATGKIGFDIRKGQGDMNAIYKFLLKKCITDKLEECQAVMDRLSSKDNLLQ